MYSRMLEYGQPLVKHEFIKDQHTEPIHSIHHALKDRQECIGNPVLVMCISHVLPNIYLGFWACCDYIQ